MGAGAWPARDGARGTGDHGVPALLPWLWPGSHRPRSAPGCPALSPRRHPAPTISTVISSPEFTTTLGVSPLKK